MSLAVKMSSPKKMALTRLLSAQSFLANGKVENALRAAGESASEFERLGLPDSLWRVLGVLAQANAKAGDRTRGREQAKRAQDKLNALKEKWSRADFESYVSRPDVASERRQVDALVASHTKEK